MVTRPERVRVQIDQNSWIDKFSEGFSEMAYIEINSHGGQKYRHFSHLPDLLSDRDFRGYPSYAERQNNAFVHKFGEPMGGLRASSREKYYEAFPHYEHILSAKTLQSIPSGWHSFVLLEKENFLRLGVGHHILGAKRDAQSAGEVLIETDPVTGLKKVGALNPRSDTYRPHASDLLPALKSLWRQGLSTEGVKNMLFSKKNVPSCIGALFLAAAISENVIAQEDCKSAFGKNLMSFYGENRVSDLTNLRLKGKSVRLRELAEADFEPLHSFASDGDFLKYQTWGPNSREQTRAYFDSISAERSASPRRSFNLAITEVNQDAFLGNVALAISGEKGEEAEIGFNVLRSAWGKGLATEATAVMIDFAFRKLGLKRIFAFCDPENVASRKVLTKAGLKEQGILKGHRKIRDRLRDSVSFSLSREEYEAVPKASVRVLGKQPINE